MLGQNVGKKFENRFYIRTNTVKKGGKTGETIFPETRIVRPKNVGKKSSEKSAKKCFLYSQEYRGQKIGGKKRAINFSRNTRIVGTKNFGKKSSEKSSKKRFLYKHEYRTKKWGEKTREIIFPETHE